MMLDRQKGSITLLRESVSAFNEVVAWPRDQNAPHVSQATGKRTSAGAPLLTCRTECPQSWRTRC